MSNKIKITMEKGENKISFNLLENIKEIRGAEPTTELEHIEIMLNIIKLK